MSKQKKKSDGPGAFAVIVLAGIAKYAFKSRHTGWILLVAAVLAAVFAVVWAVRKKENPGVVPDFRTARGAGISNKNASHWRFPQPGAVEKPL